MLSVMQSERGLFFEYSKAANPVRPDLTPPIPYHLFPSSLYATGPTRIVPLDLSDPLRTEGPATGPGLCASFVRVLGGEALTVAPEATSLVFYVIRGEGTARIGTDTIAWAEGDFFTAPGTVATVLAATSDAALYCVDDAPLLRYLGATPKHARFQPTIFKAARANEELARAAAEPAAGERSRVSVLLAAPEFPLTRTVTHVLWAMYGLVGEGTAQKPHRHQSIALDFIVDCDPGCYSLVGRDLAADGTIRNATRVEWQPGSVFVTPPGYWHAHVNESKRPARLIPIQDAGLHTYLRSLDIRFT